ncbi:hypothetical protein DMH04_30815 [Kibdelosporangium aridum]|uniref:Uncharacterized protein n=1 Tax=Kibdelosporangium aridum TaxID=2030 RepID=A0A428Z2N7_KIBAR|nr:hypothetical protein [Kibdelosporangium aridum]RSM79994.1 hypothetical protein DMH04_30815 [Kibdelosporangium aridum]
MLQLTDDTPDGPDDVRSPGRRHRLAVVLALTLVAVAASAALVRPDDARTLPSTHSEPPIFALFQHDPAAQRRISVASERLVTDCMARAGLRYQSALLALDGEPQQEPQRPFGPENLNQLAPIDEPRHTEDPSLGTHAYLHALYGPTDQRVTVRGARFRVSGPATGCVATAARQLLGDDRRRWMLIKVLLFEAAEDSRRDVESDAEFRAATRRWQGCMRMAGTVAEDPLRLLASRDQRDMRDDPAMRADIRCKQETSYLTTAYARLSVAQQRRLNADTTVAADWTRLLGRQDRVAREVLAPDT